MTSLVTSSCLSSTEFLTIIHCPVFSLVFFTYSVYVTPYCAFIGQTRNASVPNEKLFFKYLTQDYNLLR